jgi:hypothetical protein
VQCSSSVGQDPISVPLLFFHFDSQVNIMLALYKWKKSNGTLIGSWPTLLLHCTHLKSQGAMVRLAQSDSYL